MFRTPIRRCVCRGIGRPWAGFRYRNAVDTHRKALQAFSLLLLYWDNAGAAHWSLT